MGQSYRDLIAWQKSIDLVADIYRATQPFPKDELYGLVSQLRRAAVSVPSNIAEGQGRKSQAEFRHFLHNSSGSLMEVETQLTIARRLGYITSDCESELLRRTNEIGRIINGLLSSLAA
ncbi:MAG TPA: four helix bundle protein [Terriglobales bacterium]|nr:four helix bundle protein [Terriglobales bacterium]